MILILLMSAGSNPYLALITCFLFSVYSVFIYTLIYFVYGIEIATDVVIEETASLDYLYFSIVTWTTLGYGDIKPI